MATLAAKVERIGGYRTKHIAGQINLAPIEVLHIPQEALTKAGFDNVTDDAVIDWCGYISMDTCSVYVSIGDYIVIEWDFGGPIHFTNYKGYGAGHWLNHLDFCPSGLVDQVMAHFWPKQ